MVVVGEITADDYHNIVYMNFFFLEKHFCCFLGIKKIYIYINSTVLDLFLRHTRAQEVYLSLWKKKKKKKKKKKEVVFCCVRRVFTPSTYSNNGRFAARGVIEDEREEDVERRIDVEIIVVVERNDDDDDDSGEKAHPRVQICTADVLGRAR